MTLRTEGAPTGAASTLEGSPSNFSSEEVGNKLRVHKLKGTSTCGVCDDRRLHVEQASKGSRGLALSTLSIGVLVASCAFFAIFLRLQRLRFPLVKASHENDADSITTIITIVILNQIGHT